MLVFLVLLYIAQSNPDWTIEDLASLLPPPVKSVHSYPITWDFCFKPDKDKKEVKRLARLCDDNDDSISDNDTYSKIKIKRL